MMLAMVAIVASAKDIKTVIFTTTPQMHCANCENKIKGNLRFEKGVKRYKDKYRNAESVRYLRCRQNYEEKLQKAFEKFGYKAEKTTKEAKTTIHEGEECQNM